MCSCAREARLRAYSDPEPAGENSAQYVMCYDVITPHQLSFIKQHAQWRSAIYMLQRKAVISQNNIKSIKNYMRTKIRRNPYNNTNIDEKVQILKGNLATIFAEIHTREQIK